MSDTIVKVSIDPASRLRNLIDNAEPRIRRIFLEAVLKVRNLNTLDEIADLIELGRIDEALLLVNSIPQAVAAEVNFTFVDAGDNTAQVIANVVGVPVTFDQVNSRAVNIMRQNQLELISGLTQEQILATREALTFGIQQGMNPRDQARQFRESIGLTYRQQQAVNNYRMLLQSGSREVFNRQLRDRRFDSTIRNAINNDQPLTKEQIDRMVSRYSERYLKYRSEVIARTEALRAVHEGSEEMYQQAFDAGQLDRERVTRYWSTSQDTRVRDAHNGMNGQKRLVGETFLSDSGNEILYPGDPSAPASETIQCRCAIATRFS
jgi:hypothetical protein